MSGQMPHTGGAPYAPTTASLGGRPTKSLDDPICAVFLVLYVIGAVCNMTILQLNLRRGKKFLLNGMLFGFCFARTITMIMRLVWSTHLDSVPVAIAAQIFVAAGVIVIFIVNLVFAQRILRAEFPNTFAWTKWFSLAFKIYIATILMMLVALIVGTVDNFYTLDQSVKRSDHDIQLVGSTYFAVAAFLPLPMLSLRLILPKQQVEKFGDGHFKSKIMVLVFTSFILTLGAAFRAGTNYYVRPINDPAWFQSKACFYIFNFTIEIVTVYTYLLVRVDKRFIVPNNSHRAGDYSRTETPKASMLERVLSGDGQVFDLSDESNTRMTGNNNRAIDEEAAISSTENKA